MILGLPFMSIAAMFIAKGSGDTVMNKRYIVFILVFSLLALTASVTFAQEQPCTENCQQVANVTLQGLSADEIAAYQEPQFEQLFVDDEMLNDRLYQRVSGGVNVYDAPNGNVIRTLDAGFNFITVASTQDGWTQVVPGEWIQSSALSDVNDSISRFTGVFFPDEPLQYPVAWTLVNLYPSLEPGGEPRESNGLVYRHTRLTIYATVSVDGWNWYQIGPDKWVYQTHVSKITPIDRPESVDTGRWVAIDLYEQNLVVYDGDQPVFATLVSTGLPRWPTYEGTFHIYFRRVREDMSWGTPGDDFYYLEEVPWTMFFDEGRALHGEYWHDGLGYRRSHGCVNMSITDAHWLYNWVAEEFNSLNSPDVEEGPAVYVYSTGQY